MTLGIGDFIRIHVGWRDTTRYGSVLSGRHQQTIRQVLHPTSTHTVTQWMQGKQETDATHLTQTIRQERESDHYQNHWQDPNLLRPPVGQTTPETLYLHDPNRQIKAALPLAGTNPQQLAQALRDGNAEPPLTVAALLRHTAQRLGAFQRPDLSNAPLVNVGHATVSLYHAGIRVWLDPFFLPKQAAYGNWQPLSPLDLPAEQHCVLFTHSHPDHFDPASLLLFPADTLFLVPPCPDGESLLSLDMAFRLQQLGFGRVQTLPWWENIELGDFTITALPFYGEQAVGYGAAEPSLWNHGSTWHVRRQSDNTTFLFLADSGSDPRKHVLSFAREIRQRLGIVDCLFGNCRRWRLYPAQYLASSVPQYLLATPDSEIGIPQTIMMEAHELAAFAEICGSQRVFPYAMGGTPWFSELGLGYSHENHLSTDFDVDPRNALQGSLALLRLPPAFQQVDAEAGSHTDTQGQRHSPPDYPLPPQLDASTHTDYVLTLTGGGISKQSATVTELAQLASLNKQGAFVLTENFCEFWLMADDLFTRHLLEAWLGHFGGSYCIGNAPQSLLAFTDEPQWRALGLQLLHAAHLSLLTEDNGLTLRHDLQTIPFSSIPPVLLATVYQELTGVTIHPRYPATPWDTPLPEPALPAAAKHSAAFTQYPNTLLALALLVSKCLHNAWLTHHTLGKTTLTEAAFVGQLLMAEMA